MKLFEIVWEQKYNLALEVIEEKYEYQLKTKDELIVVIRQQNAELIELLKLKSNQQININNIDQRYSSIGIGQNTGTVEANHLGGTYNEA